MFLNKFLPLYYYIPSQNISSKTITKAASQLFFRNEVQQLLINLTRLDVNKVFRKQKYGQELKPPEYKFLTTEEVNKLKEEANLKALKKIQMPPLVPARDDSHVEILSDDKEILGHAISNYVFTDITFGVSDAKRMIVVREPDGVLREAKSNERHRMNFVYFSRPGSSYKHPEMFEEENLISLCNRKEYIFILDRACAQYEPDDQLYHDVISTTYNHINDSNAFELIRSTRHFGILAFFLAYNNNIDNLLLHNLHCNMMEDAVWLIQLYQLVNPNAKCCQVKYDQHNEVAFVQAYIDLDSSRKDILSQALECYSDVASVRSN